MDIKQARAEETLLSWLDRRHPIARRCPHAECGEDLSTTAIVRIAYTFEICRCGTPEYDHLIEQLWHREHLVK